MGDIEAMRRKAAAFQRNVGDPHSFVAGMTAPGRAGVADDVGPMIAALLCDENRSVNGQRIESVWAERLSNP